MLYGHISSAVSSSDVPLYAAGVTALAAAVVAVYLNAVGRKREDKNRRRDLYSEAYMVALEWCEAVYRVRRRATDGSQDSGLVERFHGMQERIAYHEGWLSIEAVELGVAYRCLLDEVTGQCKPLLRQAWTEVGRDPRAPTPDSDVDPDLSVAKAAFLRDIREHLSCSPWVRRRVRKRYENETT